MRSFRIHSFLSVAAAKCIAHRAKSKHCPRRVRAFQIGSCVCVSLFRAPSARPASDSTLVRLIKTRRNISALKFNSRLIRFSLRTIFSLDYKSHTSRAIAHRSLMFAPIVIRLRKQQPSNRHRDTIYRNTVGAAGPAAAIRGSGDRRGPAKSQRRPDPSALIFASGQPNRQQTSFRIESGRCRAAARSTFFSRR